LNNQIQPPASGNRRRSDSHRAAGRSPPSLAWRIAAPLVRPGQRGAVPRFSHARPI